MDSSELIELFYNRTYEKFVNKQILDDKNFIVPRQQLINYVHELVNIPFEDFIDYIKHNDIDRRLEHSDITQFSSFPTCELEMCKALQWTNNPGCKYIDIGRLFPNKLYSKKESAYWRFGEMHIKASTQLGLTFEYYNYWYLSCLGYIYPELEKSLRLQLLARTITRNRLYQQILIDIMEHDVNPEEYVNIFPNFNFKRCKRSVYYFLNICLDICRREGIRVHKIINNYKLPQEINQDDNLCESSQEDNHVKIGEQTDRFLLRISIEPLLSDDEEIESAQKIRSGDIGARNKLVCANMRYVIGLAKQYLHKGVEFEDLLHEGLWGLIKATEHYDETLGFRFIKYAVWQIRRSLSEAIVADSTLIKYPLNVRIFHKRLNDYKKQYERQYGFLPPIIKSDDKDSHEIKSNIAYLPENLKDTCIPYDNLDAFEDTHNDILDYEENDNNNYHVRNLLAHLSKRDSDILIRIFGIGVREETLESIGETYGLTRERVRQVKEKAIKKLRDVIYSAPNEEYMVERRSSQYMEDADCNLIINDEVETQTLREVKMALLQYYTQNCQHTQTENGKLVENGIVIFPSETSTNTCDYNVVNDGGKCKIYNTKKIRLYSSTGYIIKINNSLYRLSLSFNFFSIGLIERNRKGDFFNGDNILLVNQASSLYQRLKHKDYLKLIEDIDPKERKVKVGGSWFDEYGNIMHRKSEQGAEFSGNYVIKKESVVVSKNSKPENKYITQHSFCVQGKSMKQTTLTYNTHVFKWKVGDPVSLLSLFSGSVIIDKCPSFVFRKRILFVFISNETKDSINYFSNNIYSISADAYNLEVNMHRKYGKYKPRILVFLCNDDGTVCFFDEVNIHCTGCDFIQFRSIL